MEIKRISHGRFAHYARFQYSCNKDPSEDLATNLGVSSFNCSGAEFGRYDELVESTTWQLISVHEMDDACEATSDLDSGHLPYEGKVVFIRRGGCSFVTKVFSLQQMGAAAVVVGDYQDNDMAETSLMGGDESLSPHVTIPSVFVPGRATKHILSNSNINTGSGLAILLSTPDSSLGANSCDEAIVDLGSSPDDQSLVFFFGLVLICIVAVVRPPLAVSLGLIYLFGFKLRFGPSLRPGATGLDKSDASLALIFDDFDHIESDERVFKFLSDRFRLAFQGLAHDDTQISQASNGATLPMLLKNYHLQIHKDINSMVPVYSLLGLSRENYDAPLFHHPPLFSLAIAFWEGCLGLDYPSFPVFLSLLPPLTNAFLGIFWEADATSVEYSVLALLFMPSASFCSQKLWSDNLLAAAVWLSTSFAVLGVTGRRFTSLKFLASGIFLGLGLLVKVTALGALPSLCLSLLLLAFNRGIGLASRCAALALLFPSLMYGGWVWLYTTATGSNALSAMWPSSEMLLNSEFMKTSSSRKWHFYLSSLVRLWPVVIVAPFSLLKIDWRNTSSFAPTLVWLSLVSSYLVPFTFIGLRGGLYQSRHILPCIPALACLAGRGTRHLTGSWRVLLSALLSFGAANAVFGVVNAAPLHGDLEKTVWDIAANLPNSPSVTNPSSQNEALEYRNILRHFGVMP